MGASIFMAVVFIFVVAQSDDHGQVVDPKVTHHVDEFQLLQRNDPVARSFIFAKGWQTAKENGGKISKKSSWPQEPSSWRQKRSIKPSIRDNQVSSSSSLRVKIGRKRNKLPKDPLTKKSIVKSSSADSLFTKNSEGSRSQFSSSISRRSSSKSTGGLLRVNGSSSSLPKRWSLQFPNILAPYSPSSFSFSKEKQGRAVAFAGNISGGGSSVSFSKQFSRSGNSISRFGLSQGGTSLFLIKTKNTGRQPSSSSGRSKSKSSHRFEISHTASAGNQLASFNVNFKVQFGKKSSKMGGEIFKKSSPGSYTRGARWSGKIGRMPVKFKLSGTFSMISFGGNSSRSFNQIRDLSQRLKSFRGMGGGSGGGGTSHFHRGNIFGRDGTFSKNIFKNFRHKMTNIGSKFSQFYKTSPFKTFGGNLGRFKGFRFSSSMRGGGILNNWSGSSKIFQKGGLKNMFFSKSSGSSSMKFFGKFGKAAKSIISSFAKTTKVFSSAIKIAKSAKTIATVVKVLLAVLG